MHNVSLGGASLNPKAGSAAMAYPWNELVLAFGTNDSGWKKTEVFRAEMLEFLQTVTTRENARITVISPIPLLIATPERQKNLDDYKQIAAEMQTIFPNVQTVDGCTLVPADERLFVDGVHPNAEGMNLYAENLIKA